MTQTTTATRSALTESQITEYYRQGYILVRKLVPNDVVEAVRRIAEQRHTSEGGDWTPTIFDRDEPQRDAALHRLLVEPTVVAAAEQIFEAPARVYYGMLAIVPAGGGRGLAWHQDNMYTTLLGRALNVFIAVGDITPDMATLWVAPRTHLRGVEESITDKGHRVAEDPGNGLALPPLEAGDACIFDRNTLHHSKTNQTDRHRYAYAAQFMEEKARLAETGRRSPEHPLASVLAKTIAQAL